jgi:hypothetical protein
VRRAEIDPALGVRVIGSRTLHYDAPAAVVDDRPPHVRAASGIAFVCGRLAVIQDDTAFIGYVAKGEVTAHALPRGAGGRRRFEVGLGNKMEKLDLEACVAVGDELWAFGSGSAPAREKIAIVSHTTRLHDAAPLYRRIRDELDGEINLEGVALVDRELWLFHRGNTGPADAGPAVVRFDRARLAQWVAGEGAVPEVARSERYDLGAAQGARLGFTDAVEAGGRVFYLAAAEASPNAIDDGATVASQLGVIDGNRVRACALLIDGAPAKAEGIAFDPAHPRHAWIAIDPDDVDEPSRLYEIELVGPW